MGLSPEEPWRLNDLGGRGGEGGIQRDPVISSLGDVLGQ